MQWFPFHESTVLNSGFRVSEYNPRSTEVENIIHALVVHQMTIAEVKL